MFAEGTLKFIGLTLILAVLSLLSGVYLLNTGVFLAGLTVILLSLFLFLATALLSMFFRDPTRKTSKDETYETEKGHEGMVVAPADGRFLNGKIDMIKIVHPEDSEDSVMKHVLGKHENGILISTYMSALDVHVNRVPISGKVIKTKYYPGEFKLAQGDVHAVNEKNLIVIDSKYGKIGVVQIAGFLARRIIQYVNVGDEVRIGDRLGMIRFGSRVDLIMPYENSRLMVSEGERPKAGETIVARIMEKDKTSKI